MRKTARVHSASIIPDSSDDEDEQNAADQDGENVQFLVQDELKRYQASKGIKLRAERWLPMSPRVVEKASYDISKCLAIGSEDTSHS
jgi:hypothetical protein